MTTNDHKLGFPPVAAESAHVAESDEPACWSDADAFPLGTPNRIIEQGRENLRLLIEGLNGETAEQRQFREGDHAPDGTVSEGVTDDEIVCGVHDCMGRCKTAADLRQYSMGLVERLAPLRSRELVGKIQRLTSGHYARIGQEQRKTSRIVSTPFSPPSAVEAFEAYEKKAFVPAAPPLSALRALNFHPTAFEALTKQAQEQAERAVDHYQAQQAEAKLATSGFLQTAPKLLGGV